MEISKNFVAFSEYMNFNKQMNLIEVKVISDKSQFYSLKLHNRYWSKQHAVCTVRLLNWASVFTLLFSTYCTTYVQWACQFCYDAPMSIFHGHTLVCTALRCACTKLRFEKTLSFDNIMQCSTVGF